MLRCWIVLLFIWCVRVSKLLQLVSSSQPICYCFETNRGNLFQSSLKPFINSENPWNKSFLEVGMHIFSNKYDRYDHMRVTSRLSTTKQTFRHNSAFPKSVCTSCLNESVRENLCQTLGPVNHTHMTLFIHFCRARLVVIRRDLSFYTRWLHYVDLALQAHLHYQLFLKKGKNLYKSLLKKHIHISSSSAKTSRIQI